MKKIFTLFCALITFSSFAQQVKVPVDTTVVTNHSVTIKGKNINYSAQTGMQPVWDDQGNPIASLYYTYYKRSDIK
ncbi:MAG: carboxypeptidase, partial [Zunongwangia sp.]|nr:carboxypeptidase [Zunongwangia sp.]